MSAWGKDILLGLGAAWIVAAIAWAAGASTTVETVVFLVAWPLLTPAAHRVRRGSDPTL